MNLWKTIVAFFNRLAWWRKPEEVPDKNTIDLSQANWIGVNGRHARVTGQIVLTGFSGNTLWYTSSANMGTWEPHNKKEKNCNLYGCFFVKRNGQYIGGKYEWSDINRTNRSMKHIKTGYCGGVVPHKGEQVWFCFTDLIGKNRSNCVSVVWK